MSGIPLSPDRPIPLGARAPTVRRRSGAPHLDVGQQVKLSVYHGGALERLSAQLEAVDEPTQRIVVGWPVADRRLFPFKPGDRLSVEASLPNDAHYVAEARLSAATAEEPPHLVLKLPSGWKRIQRRRDVRLRVDLHPSLGRRVVDGAWLPIHTRITNLSAGGLELRSDDELVEGDQIELGFALPHAGPEMRVRLEVRHVSCASAAALGRWQAGCELRGLDETVRDRIVQYVFAEQRAEARRRRGLD